MRAAMLLIIVLAATISAHAEKTYWKAVEIWFSTDGRDTWTDPEPCEVGVTLDPSNNTLSIFSAEPQTYVLEQLDCEDYENGNYVCTYHGYDEVGQHLIMIVLARNCGYIYVGIDKDFTVAYKVVDP